MTAAISPATGAHDEYALTAQTLAANASQAALERLLQLASSKKASKAVEELHHLTTYSRRVISHLHQGETVFAKGLEDAATLEWAKALVAMSALQVEASGAVHGHRALQAQKSGITG